MKNSFSKAASYALSVAMVIALLAGVAYAAKDAPLQTRKAITYISRMLLNPTDATDGTVKKARSLTQSCPAWEVMQWFGPDGNLVCAPQIITQGEQVASVTPPAPPAPSITLKKSQWDAWDYGCHIIDDNNENGASYVVLCNSKTGRICAYSAFGDTGNGQWSCDAAKGYEIWENEYASCVFSRRENKLTVTHKQYEYRASCLGERGKICSYSTMTNVNGDIILSQWKCWDTRTPGVVGEFQ